MIEMAGEDVLYRVRTLYEVDGNKDGVGSLTSSLGGLGGIMGRVTSGLTTLATGAMALGGAAVLGGVLALSHGVAELNAHAEETSLTIAGMVRAAGVENASGGLATWGESMEFAQQAMRQIREDAAALPGTEEDFIQIFRSGLPGALNAGMRAADVSGFTNRFGAVGRAFQIDAPQIGRDLNLLLQGRAGAQVNMWNALRSHVGKTAEQFNAMSAPARLAALQGAIGHFDDLIRAYQDTWEAQWSTAQSHVTRVATIFSRPMFDSLKNSVRSMNDLYDRHAVAIREVAYGAGTVLAQAFEHATEKAWEMQEVVLGLLESRSFTSAVDTVMGGARNLYGAASRTVRENPGAAASSVGSVAGLALGLPGLGLALGSLASFATHTEELNATLGSLYVIGGDVLSVLEPLAAVVLAVESVLGDLLAAFLPPFADALATVTGVLSGVITMLRPYVLELIEALRPVVVFLGGALGGIAQLLANMLGPVVTTLGQSIGATLHVISSALRWITSHLGSLLGINAADAGRATGATLAGLGAGLGTSLSALLQGRLATGEEVNAAMQAAGDRAFERGTQTRTGSGIGDRMRNAAGGPANPSDTLMDRLNTSINGLRRTFDEGQGTPNLGGIRGGQQRQVPRGERPVVNVTINNTVNAAEDPDRVMVLTRRALVEALYQPLETPTARVSR